MSYVAHFPETLFLKLYVTNRENFVNYEYLRFQMRSDSKSKSNIHTARVAFHRRVDVRIDFGKRYDLVELGSYLGLRHSQDCAVQDDVFASGQFRVETGAYLQQACNPAFDPHLPFGRRGHTAEDLQQRALARTVPANDPENFALLHFKGNSAQRPHLVVAQ